MEANIIQRIEHYNLIYDKKNLSIEDSHKDVVLVWPNRERLKDMTKRLQYMIDFMKDMTGKSLEDLKSQDLPSTIIIGYSSDVGGSFWAVDKFFGNTVLLPWNYLNHLDQPIEACTHELVHPFFHISSLHGNEKTKEFGHVFCDFLRIKISKHINFEKKFIEEWLKELKEKSGDWKQHAQALQLLLALKEKCGNGDKEENAQMLKEFIQSLFYNPDEFYKIISKQLNDQEIDKITNFFSDHS